MVETSQSSVSNIMLLKAVMWWGDLKDALHLMLTVQHGEVMIWACFAVTVSGHLAVNESESQWIRKSWPESNARPSFWQLHLSTNLVMQQENDLKHPMPQNVNLNKSKRGNQWSYEGGKLAVHTQTIFSVCLVCVTIFFFFLLFYSFCSILD